MYVIQKKGQALLLQSICSGKIIIPPGKLLDGMIIERHLFAFIKECFPFLIHMLLDFFYHPFTARIKHMPEPSLFL